MKAAGPRIVRVLTALVGALVLGLGAPLAQGAPVLPSGGSVAAGQASIAPAGKAGTLITQSSQKALINWQNFSIGAGSSVTFQQPNSAAITLNRVVGPGASTIDGNLVANGQVWIINGNGILFGAGSRIDVGGLIATTSNIRDSDFLAGIYDFDSASGNPNAAVVNRGSIKTAPGGSAVLSGARVVNEGVIEAKLGKVVLGGANGFSVDFDGDNLIRYAVGAPVSETPKDANGAPAPALVSNSGTIAAEGGKVLLTTRAARSVINNVINSTGIVEATSASLQNGEIVFDAGEGGTTSVAGRLDVSGKNPGNTGGTIALLGDTVTVADGAKLDASGDAGGGTIRIGGNLHGAGPEPNAQAVNVGEAMIAADAGSNGNGGTITIYSTGETNVAAAISAKAGAQGGGGGTVETSGHDLQVAQSTHVDTSAPAGATGSWLLDPLNISVALGGSAALSSGVDALSTNPGSTDIVSPATIIAALGSTNVRLEASNDITVFDPLTYSSGNSLTFLAGRNVTFNAGVQNGGAGGIFAAAGWDGVTASANILTTPGAYGGNGGNVMIGGNSAVGGVAVGSVTGSTTVAAHNLTLQAVNGYAQLGYNLAASGNLTVSLTGDLALTGGNSGNINGSFAQIGNGAASSSGNYGGNIAVTAGGSVVLTGGTGSVAYAQIGHGGITSSGTHSGDIAVTAAGDLVLAGNGGVNNYALIGHGGASSSGLHTGDIAIMAGGDVNVGLGRIGHEGGAIDGTVLLIAGADLTLGSGASVTASDSGDALVLAAQGDFVNQAGGSVLSVLGGGRWLIFLHDPAKNVTPGGLSASTLSNHAFNFQTGAYTPIAAAGNQFVYTLSQILTVTADSKTRDYGSANPLFTYQITGLLNGDILANVVSGAPSLSTSATANSSVGGYAILASLGTLSSGTYSFQFVSGTLTVDPKMLTVALAGSVTKTYDGTLAATLAANNYTLLGAVSSDAVALNNPVSGSYDTKNIGSGKLVSVTGLALSGTDAGNYVLASTSTSGSVGAINAATLTAGLTGSVSKTYDGNLAATLAGGNYTLSGVVSGESVALNNPASGTYDTKNIGSGKLVSVTGLALSGTDAGNYVLASTNISGSIGVINAATLTAGLTGNVTKTYDGSLAATLAAGNYTLTGAVSGDAVALNNPASGSYDTKSVGSGKLVSVSGLAILGSDAGNYVLASTNISGSIGVINAATLTAGLTGNVTKTYDGTLAATLAGGNYTLSGAVSGDAVALNNPASGNYDTKNIGSGKLVSVSGLSLSGTDAGNYVLASTSTSGSVGAINAATLTAGLTGSVSKTYDGNLAATLAGGNYTLSGVVSGESVALNNPASGTYDTKNIGSGKLVSVTGLALSGTDAGNYVLASTNISGSIGVINAATLTAGLTGNVTKTYDGSLAATLAAGNYTLTGAVSGDAVALNNPASGSYDTKSVGSGKLVSVSGLAISGSDAGNYVLASTNISGSIGVINAATLTAGLTGNVTKTYDGTQPATLVAGNYTLSGAVSSDAVALNKPTSGSYDTKNVGSGKAVSVTGLALSGADAGNYVLASTNISGSVGIINAATLTAGLTGSVSKTYDGTLAATLAGGNYTLTGAVSGDAVALNNPSSGTYDTKNAGSGKVVSVSGLVLSGGDSGNYVLASTNISGSVGIINAATLTAGLTGSVSKTYDGTLAATLAGGNYTLAGAVSGDTVALNNPVSGTFDTKNVGSGKAVSVSGLALSGADAGNYVLASTNIYGSVGIINAVGTLTAGLTGTVTKTYDGTLAATLSAGNYTLSGVVSGDVVALNNPASGIYDTKNAGSGKVVSVSGLALSGADAGNYVLASTNISGSVGIINAATLTAGLTGTVTKTYDGTLAATLAANNYTLLGAVSSDAVALNNPVSGSYDTKNIGSGKLVSVTGLALSGTDAGNYVLASTSTSGSVGAINAATLTAGLTGSVSKTYDGNLAATLAGGNYTLSGVVSGESVALNNPVSGTYDTKNAGSGKLVSVSSLALSGADAGNYVLASTNIYGSVGIINAATLTAGLTGSVIKTYDGSLAATLAAGNYTLSGAVSGDAVALNNPASGNYDTKSVGSGKVVSVSGLALSGGDAGNYVLASTNISGSVGIINAATLTAGLTGSVSKTYDGNLAATLTAGNYTLSGAVSGDAVALNNPASGNYDTKNIGSGKLVSVSGLSLSGSDAGNYVLASTSTSGSVGIINAATLTAGLTGSVSKTYDGTLAATLAGGNYTLAGAVSSDAVALNKPTSGSYDTKSVGSGKLVSVSGLAISGSDAGNYVLASTNISGSIGVINAATLTAGLTGNVTKTYDGTQAATLVAGNYTLSGAVSGDGVALNNPASGTYDTKNVGSGKLVSVSGLALSGADAGNYVLASTNISGSVGIINAATLTAGLTGSVSKTYDGILAATLAAGNYVLSGAISGDAVALNNPVNGSYETKDIGTAKVVSVSGLAVSGNDAANYVLASSNVSGSVGAITGQVVDEGVLAQLATHTFANSLSSSDAIAPPASNTTVGSAGPANATMGGPGDEPTRVNVVANSVGQSLSGAVGSVPSFTNVLIDGLLRQYVPPPGGARPRAVPPVDEVYSSWGNEAFWQ